MSSQPLTAPGPSPIDASILRASPTSRPIVASLSSALLLYLSFPPADRGYLAWVAMAPLFSLVRNDSSRWKIYASGWLGGCVFWLLAIEWVRRSDGSAWLPWIVMAMFLSLWWPVFLWLTRLAVRGLGLPMMLAAPITWVALEFVQAHALTGFPWYYLAHTQYRYLPFIQVADITGAWGVSFVIAMANACWVDLVTLPLLSPSLLGVRLARGQAARLVVITCTLVILLAYGAWRIASSTFRDGPRIGLLQSSFVQELKTSKKPSDLLHVYAELINRANRTEEPPDLFVWPETSYPFGFVEIAAGLSRHELDRQGKLLDPESKAEDWIGKRDAVTKELRTWTDAAGRPMLVGTITYDFHDGGPTRYNSAILFEPQKGAVQSYDKLHLVPFGEYVPLINTMPWLKRLTPYRDGYVPSLSEGREPAWFELHGARFAAVICFEDTLPAVTRRFFAEVRDRHEPDFLLNLSNDGWFHDSAEHETHLAASIFRAVEHRVPMARAVNTGDSAVIDGNGRIVASLPKLKEDVLIAPIPLDDRQSLYTAWGDWLPTTCLAITLGLPVLNLTGFGRRRRGLEPKSTNSPFLPKAPE